MLKGKLQLLNKVNLIIWKEGRQPRSQGLLTSCHPSAKMRDPNNSAVAKQKKKRYVRHLNETKAALVI